MGTGKAGAGHQAAGAGPRLWGLSLTPSACHCLGEHPGGMGIPCSGAGSCWEEPHLTFWGGCLKFPSRHGESEPQCGSVDL